jgi:hypothetical protein
MAAKEETNLSSVIRWFHLPTKKISPGGIYGDKMSFCSPYISLIKDNRLWLFDVELEEFTSMELNEKVLVIDSVIVKGKTKIFGVSLGNNSTAYYYDNTRIEKIDIGGVVSIHPFHDSIILLTENSEIYRHSGEELRFIDDRVRKIYPGNWLVYDTDEDTIVIEMIEGEDMRFLNLAPRYFKVTSIIQVIYDTDIYFLTNTGEVYCLKFHHQSRENTVSWISWKKIVRQPVALLLSGKSYLDKEGKIFIQDEMMINGWEPDNPIQVSGDWLVMKIC